MQFEAALVKGLGMKLIENWLETVTKAWSVRLCCIGRHRRWLSGREPEQTEALFALLPEGRGGCWHRRGSGCSFSVGNRRADRATGADR